jgi:hypothetical protein
MWNMKARVIQHPTLSSKLKEVQVRLLGLFKFESCPNHVRYSVVVGYTLAYFAALN